MGFSLPVSSVDLSLVVCGSAGQGLSSLEILLTRLALASRYNIFSTQEYMSRIKGGSNTVSLRFSPRRVCAPVDRIDLLVPLTGESLDRIRERVSGETLILGDPSFVSEATKEACGKFIEVPFTDMAKDIGHKIYSNQVVLGLLSRLLGIDPELGEKSLLEFFKAKGESVAKLNVEAFRRGYAHGEELTVEVGESPINVNLEKGEARSKDLLIGCAEAVGLGAIAGGCDFLAAYPMSPSTGVLGFLADQAKEFDIIVEQCEDEIAGINMALGAWYAGSRALVSSSGGGFALMEEGVSLAAMIESPLVVHIAQRPGPATGLPTRTEQGDLELALYSGHGEFRRIIFAPASISEAFYLTQKAFELAGRFQIPVFILTDQYLMDTRVNTTPFDLKGLESENHIIETKEDYKRYAFTGTGLTPRGVPGFGKGLVMVDSDEHDETGHITEDKDIRDRMVEKRLMRSELIKDAILPPVMIGSEDAGTVLLGWGSTMEVIKEALGRINNPDILYLHHPQPYPLHESSIRHIKRAKKRIVIEGNATGQFARLVKSEAGVEVEEKILKYNGLQFSVEEITERLREVL